MAATRMLIRKNPKLPLQFLRNPTVAAGRLTESINEALNQKSPQTISDFPFSEFLWGCQKLFTEEAGFVKAHDCLKNNMYSFSGSLFAQHPLSDETQRIEVRGSKKQRIEEDEGEDEFDDDVDDIEDELDNDFDDSFDDGSEPDDDFDDDTKEVRRGNKYNDS